MSATAPAPTASLLQARGLSKSYRRGPEVVHALTDMTFGLRAGEIVALIGPSGSGKTTLLNLIAGWEEPDSGEIRWMGPAAGRAASDLGWDELAIVPQRLGLLEELDIEGNVRLPLRLAPDRPATDADDERVTALLETMGLDGYRDRMPSELSLGEQQRTALARALVLTPRLLIADEPTGHQDAESGRAVFTALRDACARGTTCLVATHNREVLDHVDRTLRIRDGRIQEEAAGAA